jgi:hypothetical protein
LEEGGGGEGGGFVGVGAVDGDIEGLVGYLPEEDAAGLLLDVVSQLLVLGCGRGVGRGGEDL